jgi:hypothetical protein
MGKIRKEDFSKRRPKLTVDDLDGGDAIALVIASVEEINVDDDDGKRKSLVLTFEESGEKVYYPNATSLGFILDAYGDESDDWVGKPLPLMRHAGTFRGERYENLQVAAPESWDEVITESNLTPVRRPAGKVKPSVAKQTRKTTGKRRGR